MKEQIQSNIESLEDKIFKNKVNQKTIDLVQNVDLDELTGDKLGSYIYEIDICIDVFNPSFSLEIEILKELKHNLELYNGFLSRLEAKY